MRAAEDVVEDRRLERRPEEALARVRREARSTRRGARRARAPRCLVALAPPEALRAERVRRPLAAGALERGDHVRYACVIDVAHDDREPVAGEVPGAELVRVATGFVDRDAVEGEGACAILESALGRDRAGRRSSGS